MQLHVLPVLCIIATKQAALLPPTTQVLWKALLRLLDSSIFQIRVILSYMDLSSFLFVASPRTDRASHSFVLMHRAHVSVQQPFHGRLVLTIAAAEAVK